MSAESWPPPAGPDTVWSTVQVSNGYGRPRTAVRVRPAVLWGRAVLIEDAGHVWCAYHGGVFHSLEELTGLDSGCPLRLRRREGMLFPIGRPVDES